MAFNVDLYTFSKKENSTAQPPASSLVRTEAAIVKQPSGIMEPVMRFTIDGNPTACNYAYIAAFGRYYYIQDWTSEPGKIWTASMRVDSLASWKSYIGSESFYVLRASAEKDGDIMDAMYPAKDTFSIVRENNINAGGPAWWNLNGNPPAGYEQWVNAMLTGYYIIGLLSVSDNYDMTGGVNYIALTPIQMYTLMNLIFNWDPSAPLTDTVIGQFYDAITGVLYPDLAERQAMEQNLTNLQKAAAAYIAENPFTDYIKSIVWVPNANTGSEITTGLSLGPTYGIPVNYKPVYVKKPYRYTAVFSAPKHPLASTRGSYCNCEPFTEIYAILPKMGAVKLPADLIAAYNYIYITLDIDPITGEGLYRLLITDSTSGLSELHEINRWYAQIGVQIQIAQTNDIGGRASAFANVAGTMLSSLTNPGSIMQLPAAIAEYQKKRETNGQTIGAAGGWLGTNDANGTPHIYGIHYNIADDDNAQNGRPLCKVRTPATLTGYMMIQDADISAPASLMELQEIKGYMESGFYYE